MVLCSASKATKLCVCSNYNQAEQLHSKIILVQNGNSLIFYAPSYRIMMEDTGA